MNIFVNIMDFSRLLICGAGTKKAEVASMKGGKFVGEDPRLRSHGIVTAFSPGHVSSLLRRFNSACCSGGGLAFQGDEGMITSERGS